MLNRFVTQTRRAVIATASVTFVLAITPALQAADVNWDNGSGDFLWNTTSLNWNGVAWNNLNIDGAIFGSVGVGTVTVPTGVVADSILFAFDGYTLNGPGAITFGPGFSTQTTGVVNVISGASAAINTPLVSAVGFQKIGGGLLAISGPGNHTGAIPVVGNGRLVADVLVGGTTGTINGGTMRVMTPAALPPSTRVSIGTGYLDIGANNLTIDQLTFTNQNPAAPWNTTLNANNGVIGSGTLRVLGEINVIGVTGNNNGNTIASNLDLGGGTQVVRCGIISSIGLNTALMFTGSISNGSLVKTIGSTLAGTFGSVDGISLHGNNTFTGALVLNSGSSVASGTNQASSIKVHGAPAGPAGGAFTLLGANGSFPAANTIQVSAGSSFILDNNVNLAPTAMIQPNIPPAQNNDRLSDTAAVTLREGNFVYRGLAGAAASETFGSLHAVGGHNVVTLTPNGGGSVTLTTTGNLTVGNRATLYVNATGAGNTLGGNAQLKFNGTIPAPDPTGILNRIASSSDFLTYNATTGLTPFTGYSPNFSTPNANVSLTAASVAPTVTINSLRTGSAFTTTIGATDTLSIASGMILSASGTGTITGGTIAFGSAPGVLFGSMNIASALSGSNGLIHATGTGTLSGDLSGLSGTLSVHGATTNLNTSTFTDPIHVRQGTLNINVSQTGTGLDPIYLGVPENEVDLTGTIPTLNFSGAGAGAVINRPIVVDNGSQNAQGLALSFSLATRLSPLSNATGTQTLNGDVTLLSDVNLQGGGGGGTGATVFTGDIGGSARFIIANGRVIFTGTSDISNAGGFVLGSTGFTAQVTFGGTGSGNGPIIVSGGNNTRLSYVNGGLPGGTITLQNSNAATAPTVVPLNNSSIANRIRIESNANVDVGAGITADWTGVIEGSGPLSKLGAGTLALFSTDSTYNGLVHVNSGALMVNGVLPSSGITVASGARVGGGGEIIGPVTINTNATLAPGASAGELTVGGLGLAGILEIDLDLNNGGLVLADLLDVRGDVNLTGSTLSLFPTNIPGFSAGTYLLILNDGIDPVIGTFASTLGVPSGGSLSIDYAFSGTDSLGRIGTGNDVAITFVIPEPSTVVLSGMLVAGLLTRRRRA